MATDSNSPLPAVHLTFRPGGDGCVEVAIEESGRTRPPIQFTTGTRSGDWWLAFHIPSQNLAGTNGQQWYPAIGLLVLAGAEKKLRRNPHEKPEEFFGCAIGDIANLKPWTTDSSQFGSRARDMVNGDEAAETHDRLLHYRKGNGKKSKPLVWFDARVEIDFCPELPPIEECQPSVYPNLPEAVRRGMAWLGRHAPWAGPKQSILLSTTAGSNPLSVSSTPLMAPSSFDQVEFDENRVRVPQSLANWFDHLGVELFDRVDRVFGEDPLNSDAPHWIECVAPAGQGKTVIGYELARRADDRGWPVYWLDARTATPPIRLPDISTDSRTLVVIDNTHYLDSGVVRGLVATLPTNAIGVSLSRQVSVARFTSDLRSIVLTSEYIGDLLTSVLADQARIGNWTPDLERLVTIVCADDTFTWEEAAELTSALVRDRTLVANLTTLSTIHATVDDASLARLGYDLNGRSLSATIVPLLAAFNFVDYRIPLRSAELAEYRDDVERLDRNGWISPGSQLHPRKAARILRGLGLLPVGLGGERVGQELARGAMRLGMDRTELARVRRFIRYGALPDTGDLLTAFYNTIISSEGATDNLRAFAYIERASELRRSGRLTGAMQDLEEAERILDRLRLPSSDALRCQWRYERAYHLFLRGTQLALADGIDMLRVDLEGTMSEPMFINRGLYAKFLMRSGRLREAADLMERLLELAPNMRDGDTLLWQNNILHHRCEVSIGRIIMDEETPAEYDVWEDRLRRDSETVTLSTGLSQWSKSFTRTGACLVQVLNAARREDAEEVRRVCQGMVDSGLQLRNGMKGGEQAATFHVFYWAASVCLKDEQRASTLKLELEALPDGCDNRPGRRAFQAGLQWLTSPPEDRGLFSAMLSAFFEPPDV